MTHEQQEIQDDIDRRILNGTLVDKPRGTGTYCARRLLYLMGISPNLGADHLDVCNKLVKESLI